MEGIRIDEEAPSGEDGEQSQVVFEVLFFILFLSVGFVAFTNGSNANVKGVASLYGSGTTSLRWTIGWGTLTTLAGSIAAIFLAEGLLDKFSGKGLVRDELLQSPIFTAAVALGAAFTSFLATRLGFPVSTTHALVGALTGAGMAGASQDPVALSALGKNFLFPLLFSPLLAIALGGMTYWTLRWLALAPDHRNRYLDAAHFASAGAASFARGLNDTPKMAALLLLVPSFPIALPFFSSGSPSPLARYWTPRRLQKRWARRLRA